MLREFSCPINQDKKRLPDKPKPWAFGICQANLLHLLPKIPSNSFNYSFEGRSQSACVRQQNYLRRQ
ncbi:MAG: hypothetical protein DME99_00460 [Verrucomicrobia bacterium]|nr:MAG: hypothetical protein DME99_00460 [Verrucomicrobiota bacterium]